MTRALTIALVCVMAAAAVHTQEAGRLDYTMLGRIRDEGLNRSQALDHVSWLADVYGPRLQGSPAMRQAADWVDKKLGGWGLAHVPQRTWTLGKGWAPLRVSADMTAPQVPPLIRRPT